MVEIGAANSRMKDFYDIWMLSERRVFEGDVLAAAIGATFKRRQIGVPVTAPLALTDAFFGEKAFVPTRLTLDIANLIG